MAELDSRYIEENLSRLHRQMQHINIAIEGDPDARGPQAVGIFQRVERIEETLKAVDKRLSEMERKFLGNDTWDEPGFVRQMKRLQLSNNLLTESNKEAGDKIEALSAEIGGLRMQNTRVIAFIGFMWIFSMLMIPVLFAYFLGGTAP